jgi:hypothetical protein
MSIHRLVREPATLIQIKAAEPVLAPEGQAG